MTRKLRRTVWIVAGLTVWGGALALVLFALGGNIVYFHTPSDIAAEKADTGQRLRIGGLVQSGSVRHGEGEEVRFDITDLVHDISVLYVGVLPDLFREGQGVVVEGMLGAGGVFMADSVLAKHDENYMPPEVAEALKRSGRWQDGEVRQQQRNRVVFP